MRQNDRTTLAYGWRLTDYTQQTIVFCYRSEISASGVIKCCLNCFFHRSQKIVRSIFHNNKLCWLWPSKNHRYSKREAIRVLRMFIHYSV